MTAGALIFAFNNESVDYVSMAAWNSHNIRRHLGIPVALITDDAGPHVKEFDKVIQIDRRTDSGRRSLGGQHAVPWHNTNRMDAYSLSPWQQTLLLDADYIIASDNLRAVIDSDLEFCSYRWAHDVSGQDDFSTMNYFGDFRMPMWWATVIMFRRGKKSKMIFDCMEMIRDNWPHYRRVYGNQATLYRNDHALSIAVNIENGHTLVTTDIPGSLATVMPEHKVTRLSQDRYRIDYVDTEQRAKYIEIHGQDLHVMSKKSMEAMIASTS